MNQDQTSPNRTQRIQTIIDKRQPYAKHLTDVKEQLTFLIEQLKRLQDQRQKIQNKEDTQTLNDINLDKFINTFNKESKHLDNLIKRFSRPTLNIGVIGGIAHGKSTFLQKVSGVDDDVIPTKRKGKACTAARSIIYNKKDIAKTNATVTFHTKDSFLDQIIKPYYEKLNLGPAPANFDEFASHTLPSLNQNPSQTQQNLYQRFHTDYWRRTDDYKDYLGTVLEEVEEKDIKKYVAQDYDDQDQLTNPECLAVLLVEISCTFTNSDVGKIALVDIPGLGDFRLGDETLLLQTMEQDVDVVLWIFKPTEVVGQWRIVNTNFYDLAKKGLNNLEKRCFIVLNRKDDNTNIDSCESLKKELKNRTRMPVVDSIIANCLDTQEVEKVLEKVLDHLEKEITNLDKEYAQDCLNRIIKQQDEMKEELKKVGKALETLTDENMLFNEKFNGNDGRSGLWGEMTNSLGQLLDGLRKDCDTEDSNFKAKITQTIIQCRQNSGIPDIETIKKDQYAEGGYQDIYYTYLKEMRANLAKQFLNLDVNLQDSLEQVKKQITTSLKNERKLADLSTSEGFEFLQEIADQLPKKDNSSSLWFGFHSIGKFNVSFAGIILRLVRPEFTPLFSNNYSLGEGFDKQETQENYDSQNMENNPNQVAENPSQSSDFDARKFEQYLNTTYKAVVDKCEAALLTLVSEPNQIAYVMVEEFVDQIFYAKGVKSEWQQFLWKNRQQVWPQFKETAVWTKLKEEWEDLVKQTEETNKKLRHFIESLT